MKITKRLLPLLIVLALLFGLTGCGNSVQSDTQPSALTVTDRMGREIALNAPARRIVALTASDCEILYAIGAGDTLIGRGEYCDYPAEVLNIPVMDAGGTVNWEEIIALKPDVVLLGNMSREEQIAQLEKAGIPVVIAEADDIAGVYQSVELLGELTGRVESANAVVEQMKTRFADIQAKAGDGTKTVYFEVSPLPYGLWTAGSGTFMDEIAGMLGVKNCFADVDGWGEISQEQVLQRDPDFIVSIAMYYDDGPTPEEEILSRPGWENVSAVKNKAVLNLRNDELSRPAPRLADGAQALFDFIYGK